MTVTSPSPITTDEGNPSHEPANSDVVTRLLEQLVAGEGVSPDLFDPTATFDATVPNWRFGLRGADPISDQLTAWFTCEERARFDELRRIPIPTGEVVHLAIEWTEAGVLHAAHQSWTIDLDGAGIHSVSFWCGGRWPAPLLAEMEAANIAATR